MSKFKSQGVNGQIKILNKMDFVKKEDHLNVYKMIDLCLDTFPYNGVTTTFEALWMNVPVVVLKGQNLCSRGGESIIKNTKIDDLLADNIEEYILKAINFTKNLDKLKNFRNILYETVLSSPLFDTKTFSKNFNDSLLKIYND